MTETRAIGIIIVLRHFVRFLVSSLVLYFVIPLSSYLPTGLEEGLVTVFLVQ
jgi:hypothetical protein